MNAGTNHHLSQLDRALVQLLNERARLVAQMPHSRDGGAGELLFEAHLADLLSRSPGPFPADALCSTFANIHAGCTTAQPPLTGPVGGSR